MHGFAQSESTADSQQLPLNSVSTYPTNVSCDGSGELQIRGVSVDRYTRLNHSGIFSRREGTLQACVSAMIALMEVGRPYYGFVRAKLKVEVKTSERRCEPRIDSPKCAYETETATLTVLGRDFQSSVWQIADSSLTDKN